MADAQPSSPKRPPPATAPPSPGTFEGGGTALLDHEVVEYLLALAIPRRDTKAQAKSLIARFGGVGPLLAADVEAICREGLSDGVVAALNIAQATALEQPANQPQSLTTLPAVPNLCTPRRREPATLSSLRHPTPHLSPGKVLRRPTESTTTTDISLLPIEPGARAC